MTNPKLQTSTKFKILNSKLWTGEFRYWHLFVIWGLGLGAWPPTAMALEVSFPAVGNVGVTDSMGPAEWIRYLFLFAQALVGLAMIYAFVKAGLLWMTGGDNSGKIAEAKKQIWGALIGLVILLGSYIFLNTINPQLVQLRNPTVQFKNETSGELGFWGELFGKKRDVGEPCGSDFDCRRGLSCEKESGRRVCAGALAENKNTRVTGDAVAGVSIGSCNRLGALCASGYRCLNNLSGVVEEINTGNISGTCTKKPAPGEDCVVGSPADSATSCFKGTCDATTNKCVFTSPPTQ